MRSRPLERLAVNAKVATVLGLISASVLNNAQKKKKEKILLQFHEIYRVAEWSKSQQSWVQC